MSFCFCTGKKDVAKHVYEVDQELGGGELSALSVCLGVRNRSPRKKRLQIPWGVPGGGGGHVTSKIEPCISHC